MKRLNIAFEIERGGLPLCRPGRRQDGVALVITLIMLSVVTITAVAFLAVTRRERASVSASMEQTEARYFAETALQRAQAEVGSLIAAATNRGAYDFFVSTNYVNPNLNMGLLDQMAAGNFAPINNNVYTNATTYITPNGQPVFNLNTAAGLNRYRASLMNLYFDPRVPVFAQSSRNPLIQPEFRYYIDLNRNGTNDLNGLQFIQDNRGAIIGTNFLWGDPEWIGILENPAEPHSGRNRAVGRMAYVVVPAGRTLDINYIHNSVKNPNQGALAFSRNQGAGSFEINLAAYLADLNTNIWNSPFSTSVDFYDYSPSPGILGRGRAFQDANLLFTARRGVPRQQTAAQFFRQQPPFNFDFMDNYGDGPILSSLDAWRRPQDVITGGMDDPPGKFWPGTDNRDQLIDVTRLVDGTIEGRISPDVALYRRLSGVQDGQGRPLFSSYDRNTFYRLLSSLGSDSNDGRYETALRPPSINFNQRTAPAINGQPPNTFFRGRTNRTQFVRRAKLNLNYAPEGNPNLDTPLSASVRSFQDWTPLAWFTNAVDRMLADEFGNGLPNLANLSNTNAAWIDHGVPVYRREIPVIGLTNVWRYDAQVHRILQLAANIYDSTHYASLRRNPGGPQPRPELPTVFRPIVYGIVSNNVQELRIAGFQEVTNALPMNIPWVDPDLVNLNAQTNQIWRYNPDEVFDAATGQIRQPILDAGGLANWLVNSGRAPNVYGVSWVVGTKKGHPTFQEGFWQSRVRVTRRMRILKTQRVTDALQHTNARPWNDPVRFSTQAQYRFDVINTAGAEAWNGYQTRSNSAAMRLFAVNEMQFAMLEQENPFNPNSIVPIVTRSAVLSTNMVVGAGSWQPQAYLALLNNAVANSFVYDYIRNEVLPAGLTNGGFVDVRNPPPYINLVFTNRLRYWVVDDSGELGSNGRLIDVVNLRSVIAETNILSKLTFPGQPSDPLDFGGGVRMHQIWNTNFFVGNISQGIALQLDASLGFDAIGSPILIDQRYWREPPGVQPVGFHREYERDGLFYFLYRQRRRLDTDFSADFLRTFGGPEIQVAYNPSPDIYFTDRRQANDPLVHFTMDDLAPGQFLHVAPEGYTEIVDPGRFRMPSNSMGGGFAIGEQMMTNHLGNQPKVVRAYAPWGVNATMGSAAPPARGLNSMAFDVAYKDPLVTRPDDWNFPTNKVPGIGWLGRIHRGTPWQTVYLKARTPEEGTGDISDRYRSVKSWTAWAGHRATRPEKDWRILDHFTTAPNDNAARGLLSVNQTNIAAWSAVLSGVPLLGNTNLATVDSLQAAYLRPSSAEIRRVVQSINNTRTLFPQGRFHRLGDVLASPALTVGVTTNVVSSGPEGVQWVADNMNTVSPLLSAIDQSQNDVRVPDEVVEQIPQQILGLLQMDGGQTGDSRVVVYSYGQSLRPAPNSIVTRPGPFFGLCTNYVVTGEYATRTVLRFDGPPIPGELRAIVEDHRVLDPEN